MGQKLKGCDPFLEEGELGPHLAQCDLGRGLPPCQVASWSIQPFGHNRHWPKSGDSARFSGTGAGSPSNSLTQCGQGEAYLHANFHLDSSNRLATIHQRHRQTDRQTHRQTGHFCSHRTRFRGLCNSVTIFMINNDLYNVMIILWRVWQCR